MCPVSTTTLLVSSLVVAVASAGAQLGQSIVQANDARKASDRDFINQSQAQNLQADQIDDEAEEAKSDRAKQALIERGRLNVIQGESGLTGATFDEIQNESLFNEGQDIATLEKNRRNRQAQNRLGQKGIDAQDKSRRNSIKQPSFVGAGLSIAGAGISAAGTKARIDNGRRRV